MNENFDLFVCKTRCYQENTIMEITLEETPEVLADGHAEQWRIRSVTLIFSGKAVAGETCSH